jgi:hypothetical protein
MRSAFAAVATVVALCACSRLPDFAAPQGGMIEEGGSDPIDGITYRALAPADFKRPAPPGAVRHGEYECGALTCATIRSRPNVIIEVRQPKAGEAYFEGRAKNVQFYSLMDRQCSWWNPVQTNAAYTLQHEQIHFAISEIEARRLNQAAQELAAKLVVTGSSKQEVGNGINERIRSLAQQYMDETMDRNREFDEDTSLGENPKLQNEWWDTVQRELAETEAFRCRS